VVTSNDNPIHKTMLIDSLIINKLVIKKRVIRLQVNTIINTPSQTSR
jgi:hypothetical protein